MNDSTTNDKELQTTTVGIPAFTGITASFMTGDEIRLDEGNCFLIVSGSSVLPSMAISLEDASFEDRLRLAMTSRGAEMAHQRELLLNQLSRLKNIETAVRRILCWIDELGTQESVTSAIDILYGFKNYADVVVTEAIRGTYQNVKLSKNAAYALAMAGVHLCPDLSKFLLKSSKFEMVGAAIEFLSEGTVEHARELIQEALERDDLPPFIHRLGVSALKDLNQ
ncbi:MAG: hypothetical protein ABJF10_20200 [Chthoniobacter sp.]|uniref:hypothetical protein n=1 Tax=Chthoniobacter sp. TaxID=2510640 RepID=UPI0032A8727D